MRLEVNELPVRRCLLHPASIRVRVQNEPLKFRGVSEHHVDFLTADGPRPEVDLWFGRLLKGYVEHVRTACSVAQDGN